MIFSKEFLPSALVMFVLVPTELLRIYGETLLMPLLARNRGFHFTALFALQTGIFVVLSAVLVPKVGLLGAAFAYTISLVLADVITYVVAARKIGLRLTGPTIAAAAEAIVMLIGAATICFLFSFGLARLVSCASLVLVWGLLAFRHQEVRAYLMLVLSRGAGHARPPMIVALLGRLGHVWNLRNCRQERRRSSGHGSDGPNARASRTRR